MPQSMPPSVAPAPTAARRNYMLAVLVLNYAINFIDRTLLIVLVEPIKRDLKLAMTQIGFVSIALAF